MTRPSRQREVDDDSDSQFRSVPERLAGELQRRLALATRAMAYNHAYLDDYFRALSVHDLVLVGAASGLGKSELAIKIAMGAAAGERRVHYFALEAEPDEIERRAKFSRLVELAKARGIPGADEIDFADWMLGRCEDVCGPLNAEVDAKLAADLETMHTLYRGRAFTATTLARRVLEAALDTDLFVIDHLHYIDDDHDSDENRATTDLIKTIRDLGLRVGRPFILVAHLRKRTGDERSQSLVPRLDDFHGSSNLGKVVTHAVVMERASGIESPAWYLSPTFIVARKDRRSGASPLVALMFYNVLTRSFADSYTLGRVHGKTWKELLPHQVPRWAKRHTPIAHGPAGSAPGHGPPADDVPHAAANPQLDFAQRRAGER